MRRFAVVAAVLALVGVASGCSIREVQLWFLANKSETISREKAKDIADFVNTKVAPGGCDKNYTGSCVPDNASQVHCLFETGQGPAVRGPLTVVKWDSFELDADGDKRACVNPVANLEVFGQELDGIAVRGYAFDPEITSPIDVDVYDDGVGERVLADDARPDVEATYPGLGANHGFDLFAPGDVGDSRKVCLFGINFGTGANTLFSCKTVKLLAPQSVTSSAGGTLDGLIEIADRVPGGVRVRGFAALDGLANVYLKGNVGGISDATELTSANWSTARTDAVTAGFTGAKGFDFVLPLTAATSSSDQVCLDFAKLRGASVDPTTGVSGNLQCRAIGS